jgi:predicted O-methyltransferase YrrM
MIISFFETKEKVISKALSCKGWTNRKKLLFLYNLVKQTKNVKGDILEIGSAFGRSTVLFGLSSRKKIWSIDPHSGGLAYIEKNQDQNSFEEFSSNLKRFNLKNIAILKHTTKEVIDKKLIPDDVPFSLVFIDGLHTPEGVTLDFELSYPLLQRGGVMAFDDYFVEKVKDYADTIDRLVQKKNIRLSKDNECKLVFFRKE